MDLYCIPFKYIDKWGISEERLDEHVFEIFCSIFIFSKSWHGIGHADRILSMDAAQLSQCSWSVIEKVIRGREIKLRIEKYSFGTFSPSLRSSGIWISMGMTNSKIDTLQQFLCIRDIIKKVKLGWGD